MNDLSPVLSLMRSALEVTGSPSVVLTEDALVGGTRAVGVSLRGLDGSEPIDHVAVTLECLLQDALTDAAAEAGGMLNLPLPGSPAPRLGALYVTVADLDAAALRPHLSRRGLFAPAGVDVSYEELLAEVLDDGDHHEDRTGTGTRSVFGRRLSYDLLEGFPRITTKYVPFKPIRHELAWFLSGSCDRRVLTDAGVTIWDEWSSPVPGSEPWDMGRVYGPQWRDWVDQWGRHHDQVADLVRSLRDDRYSRRHVVSAWNPGELDVAALPPCHVLFQCRATSDDRLDLQVYQRSADLFLGVPFNLASYAALDHMIASVTGLVPGTLTWVGGDCHVYDNHVEAVGTQLARVSSASPFPSLRLTPRDEIDDFGPDDLDASDGYVHASSIAAPVAV